MVTHDRVRMQCLPVARLADAPAAQGPGPPARPGRLSALSVSHKKSVLYGAFVWAPRPLKPPETAFSGPGVHDRGQSSARPVG